MRASLIANRIFYKNGSQALKCGFVRRRIIQAKLRKLTTQLRAKERLTMRATGIVRRIDELGRVVIPKEIRRTLRI